MARFEETGGADPRTCEEPGPGRRGGTGMRRDIATYGSNIPAASTASSISRSPRGPAAMSSRARMSAGGEIQRIRSNSSASGSTALSEGPARTDADATRLPELHGGLARGRLARRNLPRRPSPTTRARFAHYKVVDPSFHNWIGLAMALRGQQISDFPLCNKSFNLSYCGFDL